jgi:hypothetical protein
MADAISEIVQVSITAATAVPTQKGFGIAMLVGYHTRFSDPYRIYTSTNGMLSDGFTVNDPLYLMAQAYFNQNPAPPQVMIGRLPTATVRTFTLLMTDATAGNVATLTVTGKDGVPHVLSRTIPGASTVAAEATAWVTLINTALGSLGTAAATTATVTVTPQTTGDKIYVSGINHAEMTYTDTAAAAGYAAVLGNLMNVNTNWYGLAVEHADATNVAAVAAWAESQPILHVANSADSAEILGAGPVGVALKAAAYKRTGLLWTGTPQHHSSAAWFGEMLPNAFAFKTLAGVAVDNLTPTQRANLDAQNTNHYDPIAGINITRYGTAASGQYLDLQLGTDWLTARMKEAVYQSIANAPKIPYTDVGIATVTGQMEAVLSQGVRNGFLAAGSTQVVPQTVANASAADKGNRILSGMQFSGRQAGAVHKVVIQGSLSL